MPYDSNRVKLISAKDDYINASYLKDMCPSSPVFVITQSPLPATFSDFWLMVWEQQVETLICLLSDTELKSHVYFPKERGQVLTCGAYEISLHNHKEKNGFVERMINITHIKNRTSRVVVHLQFTQWPSSGVPQSPAPLLQFISDVISYQKQQRNLLRPVVVHCSAGIGRSGCFCLITALVTEMNSGHGPRDVAQIAGTVSQQRKFLIQEKEQLKFCYDAVLYYAQDLLMRRGILTTRASFDDKLPGSGSTNSHVRHPSEDFILGSGGLAKLQSGIAKMGLSSENEKDISKSEPSVNKSSLPVSNGNISVENSTEISTTVTKPSSEPTIISTDAETPTADKKDPIDKNLPSITSLLDPSNFTLDSTSSLAKRKITKENFASSKGSLSTSSSDSADPLS
ncbi:Tyrosine-protein phosphatase non-receptor type 23, partial [Stegodyphus mimosarum]